MARPIKRPGTIADHASEFWSLVDKRGASECWFWLGGKITAGYGEFKIAGKDRYCHRLALELHLGRPVVGWALHSCDQPTCCNPAHLYEGGAERNLSDRTNRGRTRGPYGDGKLNAQMVKAIRDMARGGCTKKAIAQVFGLTYFHVWDVVTRATWKYID